MNIKTGKGFYLIEVLISMLILSIGVLGAASMQLAALRNTQQSGFQTIALQLATEMADKIRTNTAFGLDDSDNPFLQVNFDSSNEPIAPNTLCYGSSANCDVLALAAFDIYELESKVKNLLPKGKIRICRDASPWNISLNRFQWPCLSPQASSPIVIKLGWREQADSTSVDESKKSEVQPGLVLVVRS